MPSRPQKFCHYPGCPNLVEKGYCDDHHYIVEEQEARSKARPKKTDPAKAKQYDRARKGTYHELYNKKEWRNARRDYLIKNPFCVICLTKNKQAIANTVDHIKPHKGDLKLFWNRNNWQSLCTQHHSEKSAREDGAWGNRRKT